MSDLGEATTLVWEALQPLEAADRRRVIAAAEALLGDDPASLCAAIAPQVKCATARAAEPRLVAKVESVDDRWTDRGFAEAPMAGSEPAFRDVPLDPRHLPAPDRSAVGGARGTIETSPLPSPALPRKPTPAPIERVSPKAHGKAQDLAPVLEAIRKSPGITTAGISSATNRSKSTLQCQLKKLLDQGKIEVEQSDHTNRYRLTIEYQSGQ